ncbi:MAG: glycosyltransferase family 1 protein [Planctomycetota bacterium]|nr:MAG: glycosyltransferase family 1 protein [Planctomycetota bacterium]
MRAARGPGGLPGARRCRAHSPGAGPGHLGADRIRPIGAARRDAHASSARRRVSDAAAPSSGCCAAVGLHRRKYNFKAVEDRREPGKQSVQKLVDKPEQRIKEAVERPSKVEHGEISSWSDRSGRTQTSVSPYSTRHKSGSQEDRRPVRIALLVTDLQPGGTPLRFARLARELLALGQTVTVGCLASPGPVSAALERDGVETFACDARGPRDLRTFTRLAAHLRRLRPDLVFSCLTHANVAARLVGRWIDVPVLTSTATIEVERPWHIRWERLTAPLDRGHVVNSRALAEHVRAAFSVPPERIHVVPPFVRETPRRINRAIARERLHLPTDAFVVLWAGRFDPVKRVELLIEAVAKMGEATVLAFAGDGPLRGALERQAHCCGAMERIRFLGWQEDLSAAFSAADAFAFPSLTEGMPNAVLQALAFGLPVIASDIPAHREIDAGQSRLLLVDQASPDAYADAIRRLRDDSQLRARLTDHGRDCVASLTPRRCAESLMRVMRTIAAT